MVSILILSKYTGQCSGKNSRVKKFELYSYLIVLKQRNYKILTNLRKSEKKGDTDDVYKATPWTAWVKARGQKLLIVLPKKL